MGLYLRLPLKMQGQRQRNAKNCAMVLNLSTRTVDRAANTMDNVVVFNAEEFKTLYPEFANVPNETLQNYFNAATL